MSTGHLIFLASNTDGSEVGSTIFLNYKTCSLESESPLVIGGVHSYMYKKEKEKWIDADICIYTHTHSKACIIIYSFSH